MENPKVSVITVVFNDVLHIESTIKNVLKQTYDNLEYIVIDGASTDGTVDIIKQYGDRIRYLSEKDKGIYDAMQKGTRIATGDWIIFRNCGDYFYSPTSINDVISRCSSIDKVDLILANARLFKKYGYKDIKPNILNKSYYDGMPVIHPSTFIRRSLQLKHPFHLEYRNSADYCFFIEAFSRGVKYCYVDVLASLFDNESGASTSNYKRSLQENIQIMERCQAPSIYVKRWKQRYRKYQVKSFFRKIIPFYSLYHSYHLKQDGWTKAKADDILKNI